MSPQVMDLSRDARLLFVGLITQADDDGRGSADARKLKASIFPADDITSAQVTDLLAEIERKGLAVLYAGNDDARLYCLPGFTTHQSINKPTKSRYPAPPGPVVNSHSRNAPVVLPESSRSTPEGSEGNGREGIGKDLTSAAAPPTRNPDWLAGFKRAYPHRSGDQSWRRAAKAGNARIAEGHTAAEFIEGARRYAAFCEATGKLGTEYVKQAATFLGPEKHFLLPWDPPATKADVRLASNMAAAREFMARTEESQ